MPKLNISLIFQKVMEYGIMSTPAIVLNDNVISYGRVLKGMP